MEANKKIRKSRFLQAIREFMEGAVIREPTMVVLKEKACLERLLLLFLFGDFLGIPIPRSYYSLKLLPHILPRMDAWRRGLLRERDWTDRAFD